MGKEKVGLEVPVGAKALRVVPIALLKVDPSYQRGLVEGHKRIAYDPNAFGVPLVGQRDDGSLWIVDGQQRIESLKILGKKECRCDVFASKGPEHEAQIFKLVNINRTKLNSHELYHALLTAGDAGCWEVDGILKELGLRGPKYNKSPGNSTPGDLSNSVRCVNTVMDLHRKYGPECVRFVLTACRDGWPNDPLRFKIEVVGGVGQFWVDNGGDVMLDKLTARLRTVTCSDLIYSAKLGIGSRFANVAAAVAKLYRKRLPKQ